MRVQRTGYGLSVGDDKKKEKKSRPNMGYLPGGGRYRKNLYDQAGDIAPPKKKKKQED